MSNKKSCALEERHNSCFFNIKFHSDPLLGKQKRKATKGKNKCVFFFMNAKVSACLRGAIELHFLWNKVFFYLADLTNKIK